MENINTVSENPARKKTILPFLLCAIATLIFTLLVFYAGARYGVDVATDTALEVLEYHAADPRKTDLSVLKSDPAAAYGNENAVTVIRLFTDLECPSCAALIEQSISKYTENEDYRVEFYDFPSENHIFSRAAAAYARCAASQGIDYLIYVRQLDSDFSEWTSMLKETNVTEYLLQAAVKYGADSDKMNLCVIGSDVYEKIDSNIADAAALGASGTPSFVIGDHIMSGYVSDKTFRSLLEKFGH